MYLDHLHFAYPFTFSSSHRFSDLHDCPSLIDKLASAKPPHRSTQPPTPVIPTRKPPRDPVKLAQWRKVELMKMRHRANPADPKDRTSSVSVDQRIHVKIVKDNQENVFWLRKVCLYAQIVIHLWLMFDKGNCHWEGTRPSGRQYEVNFPRKCSALYFSHTRNLETYHHDQPLQVSAFPFHGGEGIILQNNKPLADQIEDGSILTIQTRQ